MKNILDDGIRFPGFLPKKTGFNRTGPVRFEPVFGPVRLIFHKTGFLSLNRTEPNREHPYLVPSLHLQSDLGWPFYPGTMDIQPINIDEKPSLDLDLLLLFVFTFLLPVIIR
jgi:hypothetical protein